jgi:hypothetical protein
MKHKHTSGPWVATEDQYGTHRVETLSLNESNRATAICATGPGAENQANARLIAAVPDMVQAFKDIEDKALRIGTSDDPKDDIELARVILMEARGALWKALGTK